MLFKSKMIYDPTRERPWGNAMGLTIGLTFHTPKFWSCKTHDFYANQFDQMRYRDGKTNLTDKDMEYRYLTKLAHAKCKRKGKHMSYRGYMYWTGPKRRYTFRYMGRLNSANGRVWWKPFSSYKHGQYTRWLDNGPKSPKRPTPEGHKDVLENPAWIEHRKEFGLALESARKQMNEYERVRGVIR